jgi:glycosyltransferase involved in cell wall biosynthesis
VSAAAPAVSVVVPALNAAETIEATLAALARQELPGGHETIVVDDGSDDGTAQLAAAAGARVLRQERRGAAEARNRGAAAAAARVLAFTDSDCVPTPTWLATGLRALENADLVQGAVSPTPGVYCGPFDRSLWVDGPTGLWESANLFVRRDLFERLGGFEGWLDHRGGRPFAEDTWFGWRAVCAGARTAFAPEAVVHHHVFRRGVGGYLAEQMRRQYFPAVVRQMPELRDEVLFARVFLSRRSGAFDLAVAATAVALARRSVRPLVATAPYMVLAGRAALPWGRRAPVVALAGLAADAVGFAGLVRGSLERRSLLL